MTNTTNKLYKRLSINNLKKKLIILVLVCVGARALNVGDSQKNVGCVGALVQGIWTSEGSERVFFT